MRDGEESQEKTLLWLTCSWKPMLGTLHLTAASFPCWQPFWAPSRAGQSPRARSYPRQRTSLKWMGPRPARRKKCVGHLCGYP